MTTPPQDRRLLTEHSREGDLLQHRPLAIALASAILDTPEEESLGIVLYGSWGQGKSTIGRLVKECLDKERKPGEIVFVEVEAWKYAHEGERLPLRRHYLLCAYEAAGLYDEAKRLRNAFSRQFVSQSIAEDWQKTPKNWWKKCKNWCKKPSLKAIWHGIKRRWLALILLIVLAFLWFFFPTIAKYASALVGGISALLIACSLWLGVLMRTLAAGFTVTASEDPFRSVEEFDAQFNRLLTEDATSVKRFVFFIDDLDRCGDDIIVEAIETLQAFFGRSRCAYIVAADERQLKRAVRARSAGPADGSSPGPIPIDETFLEKVFHVAVQVPPLYHENLIEYARSVSGDTELANLNLAPEELEYVLSYLVHTDVSSPRQVRVILNDFLLTLFEAEEREKDPETHLPDKRLTGDLRLLAKVVVLRAHYPWFFRLLYQAPQYLVHWPGTFGVAPDDWSGEQRDADLAIREAASRAVREANAFVRTGERAKPRQAEQKQAPDLKDDTAPDGKVASAEESVISEPEQAVEFVPIEDLVGALRRFLTFTAETRPEDAARVEEYLYLRGRKAFAGLTGTAGQALRRSIESGDVSGIEVALEDDSSQAVAAAQAAIDRTIDGTAPQRRAARLALLGLVSHLDADDIEGLGSTIVHALYPDGVLETDDDVRARTRLVPYFDGPLFSRHLETAWPEHVDGVRLIIERGRALQLQSVVAEAIATNSRESALADAVGSTLLGVAPEIVATYVADMVTTLAPLFSNPSEMKEGVRFALAAVVETEITGTDPETGNELKLEMAENLGWPIGSYPVGEVFVVDVLRFGDRWEVSKAELESDRSQSWIVPALPVVSAEARQNITLVLKSVFGTAKSVRGEIWKKLGEPDYAVVEEARLPLGLLKDCAESGRLTEPSQATTAILEGAGLKAFPDATLEIVIMATTLGEDGLKGNEALLLAYAVESIANWNDEQSGRASEAIKSVTQTLRRESNVRDRLLEALKSLEWEDDIRALRLLIAPVFPELGAELAAALVAKMLEDDITSDETAHRLAVDGLALLEGLAVEATQAVADRIRELDVPSSAPDICEGFVRAVVATGVRDIHVERDVIVAAGRNSASGARSTLAWGASQHRPTQAEVLAVLEGAAANTPRTDLSGLVDFVLATGQVVPVIDQLGFLSQAGALDVAELIAPLVGVRGDLQSNVFRAARNVKKTELVESRFRYAESWRGRSKKADEKAVRLYVQELKGAGNEARLLLITQSLLRYFPAPGRIHGWPDLRDAIIEAMTRLTPIRSTELQEALETARSQLRLETSSRRPKVMRLFDLFTKS